MILLGIQKTVEQEREKGNEGESESDAILIDVEARLEVALVERQPEDLRIVFVEIDRFVLGLVPLSELGGGFGRQGLVAVGAGAANGGAEAIGLGLGVGLDVGLESVEEEDGDSEEG